MSTMFKVTPIGLDNAKQYALIQELSQTYYVIRIDDFVETAQGNVLSPMYYKKQFDRYSSPDYRSFQPDIESATKYADYNSAMDIAFTIYSNNTCVFNEDDEVCNVRVMQIKDMRHIRQGSVEYVKEVAERRRQGVAREVA